MSAGIVSFGAYIPIYRLNLATVSQIWGRPARRGEKAVANWDEDSLTMATEAVINCLDGIERKSIDSLYLATTTPPYREKQSASIIAKVLDMRRDTSTVDITDSLRGGTIALRLAMNAVNSGAEKRCVVVASDCRVPAPDTEFELSLGDGSAALLLGDSDLAVQIEGSCGISSDFMDIWKRDEDRYIQAGEDRFVIEEGYIAHLRDVISELFKKYKVGTKDFSKVVINAYDARRHSELVRTLGFTPEQVQDSLLGVTGHTGTASTIMMLVAALEGAKAGDRILLANYGDGADAFILRATERIEKVRDHRSVKKYLDSRMMLSSYGKYLHFRNLMEWEARFEPSKYASLAMSWRDRDWILSCKGYRCKSCQNIIFPPQKICSWCQTKDNFEQVRLSDKKGTLFSYNLDNLAVSVDPPNVIAIVDLEGGGRFSTIMTDRDTEKLSTDMPVELTFRRMHEGKNIHNYFWKCRPIRG